MTEVDAIVVKVVVMQLQMSLLMITVDVSSMTLRRFSRGADEEPTSFAARMLMTSSMTLKESW
jgi:hypothetical protein